MSRAKIQQAIDTIYAKIFNQSQGDLVPDLVAAPTSSTTRYSPTAPTPWSATSVNCYA